MLKVIRYYSIIIILYLILYNYINVGFWLEPKLLHPLTRPMLTTIGSPNFGYRSFERDVEVQAWIYSESATLHQQWHQVS
jgi:phosphatidylserine/phosphatidylglycerophosphate/cardiolipin synthase-like enzyme